MTYAVSAWWGYTTAADKQSLEALICRAAAQTYIQLVAGMREWLFLREYRQMNIMYYNNCYLPLPAINKLCST